jgi:hypothetical protein
MEREKEQEQVKKQKGNHQFYKKLPLPQVGYQQILS